MSKNQFHEDQELVRRIKRGDYSVFELLYENCFNMIAKLVLKNRGTMDDAKDIFQDTLIIFIKKVRKQDFMLTSKLCTFIYGIARLLWLNKNLKKGKFQIVDIDDALDDIQDLSLGDDEMPFNEVLEEDDPIRILIEQMKTLPQECQDLLEKHYFFGSPWKDIAKNLGLDPAAVRQRGNRCLKKLRSLMFKILGR